MYEYPHSFTRSAGYLQGTTLVPYVSRKSLPRRAWECVACEKGSQVEPIYDALTVVYHTGQIDARGV